MNITSHTHLLSIFYLQLLYENLIQKKKNFVNNDFNDN